MLDACIMYSQRATKLPVLFHPYLQLFMYTTFHYLTVSCIPATGTFQYLTVLCIPVIGHVHDISIPDSFMYTCYRSGI